jgi:hypothetical protein
MSRYQVDVRPYEVIATFDEPPEDRKHDYATNKHNEPVPGGLLGHSSRDQQGHTHIVTAVGFCIAGQNKKKLVNNV